jgi:hypothetical protein
MNRLERIGFYLSMFLVGLFVILTLCNINHYAKLHNARALAEERKVERKQKRYSEISTQLMDLYTAQKEEFNKPRHLREEGKFDRISKEIDRLKVLQEKYSE